MVGKIKVDVDRLITVWIGKNLVLANFSAKLILLIVTTNKLFMSICIYPSFYNYFWQDDFIYFGCKHVETETASSNEVANF